MEIVNVITTSTLFLSHQKHTKFEKKALLKHGDRVPFSQNGLK